MARVLIIGWPKTGKTTLAKEMGGGRSTDEVIDMGWSEASEEVSNWIDNPGDWVIEGVALPRALRKWRDRNPDKKLPVDKVIVLRSPHEPLTPQQITMGKGMDTVMSQVMPWLSQETEVEVRF
jgi:adenylate kinase family enzyme